MTNARGRFLATSFVIAGIALTACGGSSTPASPGPANGALPSSVSGAFKFKAIVDPADRTFNEALGIDDGRTVAGYYGSGATGHPNQGYTAVPGFSKKDFSEENYPGAAQTQVRAINGSGDTAGFWVDSGGVVRGFIDWNGVFTSYNDPNAVGATEILGLNDSGIAVGFYVGASNIRYAFTLDRATGTFTAVSPPSASNVTAAAVNDSGDIVGYYGAPSSSTGFLDINGAFTTLTYPSSSSTLALGVNSHDAIVGSYSDASGTHGFWLHDPLTRPAYVSIDAPQGAGRTTLNGVNDRLNMVGYYIDGSGNTIGLLVERKKM